MNKRNFYKNLWVKSKGYRTLIKTSLVLIFLALFFMAGYLVFKNNYANEENYKIINLLLMVQAILFGSIGLLILIVTLVSPLISYKSIDKMEKAKKPEHLPKINPNFQKKNIVKNRKKDLKIMAKR